MNDKCAAGTGRFFEVLTHRLLGIKMEELSDLMKKSKNACTISSMCTIFAESEIISYLSQKIPIEDIAAGTGRSIARRILAMGRSAQIQYLSPSSSPAAWPQRGPSRTSLPSCSQARNGGQDAPVHRGPRRRAQGPQGVRQAAERLRPANTTKREMRRS